MCWLQLCLRMEWLHKVGFTEWRLAKGTPRGGGKRRGNDRWLSLPLLTSLRLRRPSHIALLVLCRASLPLKRMEGVTTPSDRLFSLSSATSPLGASAWPEERHNATALAAAISAADGRGRADASSSSERSQRQSSKVSGDGLSSSSSSSSSTPSSKSQSKSVSHSSSSSSSAASSSSAHKRR